MDTEYQKFIKWLSSPFTTDIPWWQVLLLFVVFVVLAHIVWDNLELFKKGIQP